MNNLDTYKKVFIEALDFDEKSFSENLKYQDIDEWDSIGHMSLISALEEKFSVTFETDDIISFDCYKRGIEILKKYKIDI